MFRVLQRLGSELAMARAPDLLLGDEAGLFKDVNMFHHRRKGHAVGLGEFGDGSLAEHERG